MRRIAAGMEAEFPATNRNWGVWIERPQRSMFNPKVRASLLVLLGAVGAVLLIACANVANLVLARAASRQRELTLTRRSGRGRHRLARQLLTESVSLALVRTGHADSPWRSSRWRRCAHSSRRRGPRVDEIRLDGMVLGFGLLVTTRVRPVLRHDSGDARAQIAWSQA